MISRFGDINRLFGTMDIMRRLDNFYRDFDRAYSPELSSALSWGAGDTVPQTNLHEDGDVFEIHAELPGFGKEDLKVKVQGNYLEISGKKKSAAPDKYSVHRTERNVESFSRSFTLPADVDSEKVKANLENGILYLSLPKSEAAKSRQIQIS